MATPTRRMLWGAQPPDVLPVAAADTAGDNRRGADADAERDARQDHGQRKGKRHGRDVLDAQLADEAHLQGLHENRGGDTDRHWSGELQQ